MAKLCAFSLIVISLLFVSSDAVVGLFDITCQPPCDPQPANIPEGDQANCIGSCFYVRRGSKVTIEMTWVATEAGTEEFTQWYSNGELIGFTGGRVESAIVNGESYTRIYSVNFPNIYFDSQGGKTEYLTISDITANGNYTVNIIQGGQVFNTATSLVKLVPRDPPRPACRQAPVDVCFAIDGSGSLSATGFNQERDFVVSVVTQLTSATNRYCYTIFSSVIQSTYPLTSDRDAFSNSLQSAPYNGGGTDLLGAITHADDNLLTNANRIDNRRRILFFLTDGEDSSTVESLSAVSQNLHNKGAEVIAIGFGANIDTAQLNAIGITDSFVFTSFEEATLMIGNITSRICEVECCKGAVGLRGMIGPKGYAGAPGDDGVPGICNTLEDCLRSGSSQKGNPGRDGQPGDDGAPGTKGINGERGPQGNKGRKGESGTPGAKGGNGDKGAIGNPGAPGQDGNKGSTGETGREGDKGTKGRKGFKGSQGDIGVCRSDACRGNKGSRGDNGQKGENGLKGFPGQTGAPGSNGRKGQKGNLGENGPPGLNGETGERGDAIEKRVFVDEGCSPSGALFIDPETRNLYYCEKGSYLCISSNGSCGDVTSQPPCMCDTVGGMIKCGEFRRSAASQACANNVAVDFIFVVDDTSSMVRQQDWLRTNMPVLDEALKDLCIGNASGYPNRYQIIGYGGNKNIGPLTEGSLQFANAKDPHFVLPDDQSLSSQFSFPVSDPTFTIDKLDAATGNLQNIRNAFTGQDEVAYEALQYALDNAVIRDNTPDATFIPVLLLLTNGDADDYTDAYFTSLLNQFLARPDMVLAFALNFGEFTTSDSSVTQPFGVANNYEGEKLTAWVDGGSATMSSVAYGVATTDVSSSVTSNPEFRNVNRDFIDLLLCSKRSSASFWDLDFVVSAGAQAVGRFTDAFIRQNSDAIVNRAQSFTCRLCYCTPSKTESCVIVQDADICECVQGDNPPPQCPCVISALESQAEGLTSSSQQLSPQEAASIKSTCGLIQDTTPSSANCREYINSIN